MPATNNTSELLADTFVSYLFQKYQGTRHVRRVASWLGFIIKAVDKLPNVSFSRRHARQLGFQYKGRTFKARYNHKAGGRGGIEIVEILPGRGAPEGKVAVSIISLSDAEDIYTSLRYRLNQFIETTHIS